MISISISIQECIYWMKSVIWRHPLEPFIFSVIVLLFQGSTWNDSYVKDTVSISQHLLQPSIPLQAVCGWFGKKWICFFWGKLLYSSSFKGAYLLYRTSCSNICLKSAVLNARKYVQPSHCLFVNVLICNFTIVISAIH